MEGEEEKENDSRKKELAKKKKGKEKSYGNQRKGALGEDLPLHSPLRPSQLCIIHYHLLYDQTDICHFLIHTL